MLNVERQELQFAEKYLKKKQNNKFVYNARDICSTV